MRLRSRILPSLVAWVAWIGYTASLACTELPPIEANTCGNGVVEPGEDCDTFAQGTGLKCRAKGEALACRYDCKGGGACPTGWGCGADGVCREPTGRFEEPINTFDTAAESLALGDLDGDRQAEIFAFSKPDPVRRQSARVFFFDDVKSPPSASLLLRTPVVAPVVGDLNKDGRVDLAFSSLSGINIMLGQAERILSPQAFSRFPLPPGGQARMTVAHGVNNPPYFQAPLLFLDMDTPKGNVKFMSFAGVGSDIIDTSLALLEGKPSDLVGDPVAADIIEKGSPCEEVLYTFKGSTQLTMLSLCDSSGTVLFVKLDELAVKGPRVALTKPVSAPEPILGFFAHDLNADGHIDVIMRTKSGAAVSFGIGDGTFNSSPDGTGTAGGTVPMICSVEHEFGRPPSACGFPLAIGPQWTKTPALGPLVALPNDVIRVKTLTINKTGVSIVGTSYAERLAGDWTVAKIADFNGNGIPDVALGSNAGLDIDFFNGAPSGLINPSKIPTTSPVGSLAVGDLDGDLINDLGFTELNAGGKGIDALHVSYGRAAGTPEDPLFLGNFPNIRQIFPALFEGSDAIEELGLAYSRAEGDQMTVLTGNGDRQLLSPFGLISGVGTSGVQGGPLALAIGNYDSEPNFDMAAIAFDDNATILPLAPMRFWLAPIAGDARLSVAYTSAESIPGVQVSTYSPLVTFELSPILRAGDVDGDKIDEIVALFPTKAKDVLVDAPSTTLIVAKSKQEAKQTTFEIKTTIVLPQPAWGPGIGSELAVADIDGDGARDLVVLLRNNDGKSVFFVAWNDGKGGFDATRASTLTAPDGKAILGFTVVQADLDPQMEIAAVSENGGFMVDSKSGQPHALTLESQPVITGGRAIAAGDVTGDGINDLVVSTGSRVTIYPGVPKLP